VFSLTESLKKREFREENEERSLDMFYNCNITEEDGMYIAQFPDMPNVLTYGETYEEAIAMARDALDAVLTTEIEDGHKIPASRYKRGVPIAVFPDTEKLLPKNSVCYASDLAFA